MLPLVEVFALLSLAEFDELLKSVVDEVEPDAESVTVGVAVEVDGTGDGVDVVA